MDAEIISALSGYRNPKVSVRRGITHTHVRVECDDQKISRPGFIIDIFINRRTQEISIARIDNADERILRRISAIVLLFQF